MGEALDRGASLLHPDVRACDGDAELHLRYKLALVIERLAALCREHLLEEKILVAPSLAIGHQIADAVAHSGTPWVNLRVETIRTLSDAVAGFLIVPDRTSVYGVGNGSGNAAGHTVNRHSPQGPHTEFRTAEQTVHLR